MLSNAYLLAKFRFDTAENEPSKNLQKFENFANFADPNPLTLILIGFAPMPTLTVTPVCPQLTLCPPLTACVLTPHQLAPTPRIGRRRQFLAKFGATLLVFGCIGTDFCKKIYVLQHFSKSTKLSS